MSGSDRSEHLILCVCEKRRISEHCIRGSIALEVIHLSSLMFCFSKNGYSLHSMLHLALRDLRSCRGVITGLGAGRGLRSQCHGTGRGLIQGVDEEVSGTA